MAHLKKDYRTWLHDDVVVKEDRSKRNLVQLFARRRIVGASI